MKYKTFIQLVTVGVVGLVGALFYWLFVGRSVTPAPVATPPQPAVATPIAVVSTVTPPAVTTGGTTGQPATAGDLNTPPPAVYGSRALRQVDKDVLAAINTPISGDKVKDAFKGAAYKVNLFQDAGQKGPNRVKIDLDRDEKWDEKWTIERDGVNVKVKRQVAPNDDENYTEEYRLREGAWVKK